MSLGWIALDMAFLLYLWLKWFCLQDGFAAWFRCICFMFMPILSIRLTEVCGVWRALAAISRTILSPRSASSATVALNLSETWLRHSHIQSFGSDTSCALPNFAGRFQIAAHRNLGYKNLI